MKLIHILGPAMLYTNTFLVLTEAGHAVAIDPAADPQRYLDQLEQNHAVLTHILLTHGHYDHVGALPELRKALPDVPVYLHPAEVSIRDGVLIPDPGPTVDYADGSTVAVGGLTVEVIHTPGHTPGGVVLQVEDALFTGDTLFEGSMGRTDLEGGSETQLLHSLKRLAQLPGDYRVFPGHEGSSTLERERTTNFCMLEAMRRG